MIGNGNIPDGTPPPTSVEPPWTVRSLSGTTQTLFAWPTFLPSGPQWGLRHQLPTEISCEPVGGRNFPGLGPGFEFQHGTVR